MRDARPEDAAAIGEVWAAASPLTVRTAARAAADLLQDGLLGRRRWVGLLDDVVVGTATARSTGEDASFVSGGGAPRARQPGVGSALLRAAVAAFPDNHELSAVCSDDPIALAFAVRHGFLPTGEHQVSGVDPRHRSRCGSAAARAVPAPARRPRRPRPAPGDPQPVRRR